MDSLSRKQQRSLYIVFGAILCAHVALMWTNIQTNHSIDLSKFANAPEAIKVTLVQEALKDMALSQRRQIVNSEDSAVSEKTHNAYLSDKDRKFDRQTVAKNTDVFSKAAMGNAAVTQKAQQGEKQEKAKPNLKDLKLSDFGMSAHEPAPSKSARTPSNESLKGMKNGDPLAQGLSATNDYVEEAALGDFTHLNTVEYKFFGFYHRIRQKLEQFWGRSIQEKAATIFRSGRRLPASENLVTSLQVTLNEKGEIVAVKILGASGVRELDDAAVESFNEAGPFPNPPKELLVNGKATIDWGFVVKS